jgi:hypothetical protein
MLDAHRQSCGPVPVRGSKERHADLSLFAYDGARFLNPALAEPLRRRRPFGGQVASIPTPRRFLQREFFNQVLGDNHSEKDVPVLRAKAVLVDPKLQDTKRQML